MPEPVCNVEDIDELESKGFTVKLKRKKTDIFLVKKEGEIYGYVNRCPHAHANLDWNPDDFLDAEKKHIICAVHGATFKIEDGSCLGGPCNGEGLTPITIKISGNKVYPET